MKHTRFVSLVICAALTVCLLAGCGNSASSSPASGSSAASSAASSASESIPSSRTEASITVKPGSVDTSENSPFSLEGFSAAIEASVGVGPGSAGSSLRSVGAAADLLTWAESANLSDRTAQEITDVYTQWYDALGSLQQENFAEAWPSVKADAEAILKGGSDIASRAADAGVTTLPDCSEKNWQALESVLDELVPEAKGEY